MRKIGRGNKGWGDGGRDMEKGRQSERRTQRKRETKREKYMYMKGGRQRDTDRKERHTQGERNRKARSR